jgi:hypothetical protein
VIRSAWYAAERCAASVRVEGAGDLDAPLRAALVLTHTDFADQAPPGVLREAADLVMRALAAALAAGDDPRAALAAAEPVAAHTGRYHSALAATLAGPMLVVAGVGRATVVVLDPKVRYELRPTELTPGVLAAALGRGGDAAATQRRIRIGGSGAGLLMLGNAPAAERLTAQPPEPLLREVREAGKGVAAAVAVQPRPGS